MLLKNSNRKKNVLVAKDKTSCHSELVEEFKLKVVTKEKSKDFSFFFEAISSFSLYLFYVFSIFFVHSSQKTRTDIKKDAITIWANPIYLRFTSSYLF
jgi:hypothetical protein